MWSGRECHTLTKNPPLFFQLALSRNAVSRLNSSRGKFIVPLIVYRLLYSYRGSLLVLAWHHPRLTIIFKSMITTPIGYEIPAPALGQLKEHVGFLVSRCLTLPDAQPDESQALFEDFPSPKKKKHGDRRSTFNPDLNLITVQIHFASSFTEHE